MKFWSALIPLSIFLVPEHPASADRGRLDGTTTDLRSSSCCCCCCCCHLSLTTDYYWHWHWHCYDWAREHAVDAGGGWCLAMFSSRWCCTSRRSVMMMGIDGAQPVCSRNGAASTDAKCMQSVRGRGRGQS